MMGTFFFTYWPKAIKETLIKMTKGTTLPCEKHNHGIQEQCEFELSPDSEQGKSYTEIVKFQYSLEEKREQSILEQTGRLLVSQSILTAAIYTIIPTLLDRVCISSTSILYLWILTAAITALTLIALMFVLSAQWRYRYSVPPELNDIKVFLQSYDTRSQENCMNSFYMTYLEKMCESLKKNNNSRCRYLKIAMVLFFLTLLLSLAMIIVLFYFSERRG